MQMSYRRLNEFIGKMIQCLGMKETLWHYRLFQIFTKSEIANEQSMSQLQCRFVELEQKSAILGKEKSTSLMMKETHLTF